jgi:hypothetical protein
MKIDSHKTRRILTIPVEDRVGVISGLLLADNLADIGILRRVILIP